MRLPKHVLVCLVAACEPAHQVQSAPVAVESDLTRAASEEPLRMAPMAAPRFAQPQPQPQPSPPPKKLQPKPKPHLTTAVCGNVLTVGLDQVVVAECGRG